MTPWRMAQPLGVILVLALAWCAFWLMAVETARREYTRLPDRGLRLDCQSEEWAGFPFRITLICTQPVFRIGDGAVTIAGHGGVLSVTALAYRPTHVIAELAAPSSVTLARSADTGDGLPDQTTLASERGDIRIGVQFDAGRIDRLSGRVSEWAGRFTAMKAGRSVLDAAIDAASFALHWGPVADAPGARTISAEGASLTVARISPAADRPQPIIIDRAEIAATVARPADFAAGPLGNLKAWQAADGSVEVRHLMLVQGDREIAGTGQARLDAVGRLEGEFDIAVKDMSLVLRELIAAGRLRPEEAVMARTAIDLLASGAPAPRPGWKRIPVKLSKGRIYIGPFKIAVVAPLF